MTKELETLNIPKCIYLYDEGIEGVDFRGLKKFVCTNFGSIKFKRIPMLIAITKQTKISFLLSIIVFKALLKSIMIKLHPDIGFIRPEVIRILKMMIIKNYFFIMKITKHLTQHLI